MAEVTVFDSETNVFSFNFGHIENTVQPAINGHPECWPKVAAHRRGLYFYKKSVSGVIFISLNINKYNYLLFIKHKINQITLFICIYWYRKNNNAFVYF